MSKLNYFYISMLSVVLISGIQASPVEEEKLLNSVQLRAQQSSDIQTGQENFEYTSNIRNNFGLLAEKFTQSEAHIRYIMATKRQDPSYYVKNFNEVFEEFIPEFKQNLEKSPIIGSGLTLTPEAIQHFRAILEDERRIKEANPELRFFYHARSRYRAFATDVFSTMMGLLYDKDPKDLNLLHWYSPRFTNKEEYLKEKRYSYNYDCNYTLACNVSIFGNFGNPLEDTSRYWLANHSHSTPPLQQMLSDLNLPSSLEQEYISLLDTMVSEQIISQNGRLLFITMDSQTADELGWMGYGNMPSRIINGTQEPTFFPSVLLARLCQDPQKFETELNSEENFKLYLEDGLNSEEINLFNIYKEERNLKNYKKFCNIDKLQARLFFDPQILSSGRVNITYRDLEPQSSEKEKIYWAKIRSLCETHLIQARPFLKGLHLPFSKEQPPYITKLVASGFPFIALDEVQEAIHADNAESLLEKFKTHSSLIQIHLPAGNHPDKKLLWEYALQQKKWKTLNSILDVHIRQQVPIYNLLQKVKDNIADLPKETLFKLLSAADPSSTAMFFQNILLNKSFMDNQAQQELKSYLSWLKNLNIPSFQLNICLKTLLSFNPLPAVNQNNPEDFTKAMSLYELIAAEAPIISEDILISLYKAGYYEKAMEQLEHLKNNENALRTCLGNFFYELNYLPFATPHQQESLQKFLQHLVTLNIERAINRDNKDSLARLKQDLEYHKGRYSYDDFAFLLPVFEACLDKIEKLNTQGSN